MKKAIEAHQTEYDSQPDVVVSAPARVHLLGERSWYFKDKTLSIAVDKFVYVVVSLRSDSSMRFYFHQLNERKRAQYTSLKFRREDRWANMPKSIISAFLNCGYKCPGVSVSIYSEILPSVGFGITTAIKVAFAQAMRELIDPKISDQKLIQIIEKANKLFLSVNTYHADIFTAMFAKKEMCILTDYNNLSFSYAPFCFDKMKILLTDAKVPRTTVWNEEMIWTPEYACLLGDLKVKTNDLISYEVTDEEINEVLENVTDVYKRKLICIIKEQQQLILAFDALKHNNFNIFSRAVLRSHDLFRDLYSVSCPEVDWLVKRVQEFDTINGGVLSGCARITGKGYATYTIATQENIDLYLKKITEYEKIFDFHPLCYLVETTNGICIKD